MNCLCEKDLALFNQINESIGYQNSADCCEIWPGHSLNVVKPKLFGDQFLEFIYNISPVANFKALHFAYSLLFERDRLIKNNQSEYQKNAHTLGFDTLLIQLNDTWSFSRLFAIFFCGFEETFPCSCFSEHFSRVFVF